VITLSNQTSPHTNAGYCRLYWFLSVWLNQMAISRAVNASGAVNLKTAVLMSPEDMNTPAKKGVNYRSPGR
jgi:hypothetical protein